MPADEKGTLSNSNGPRSLVVDGRARKGAAVAVVDVLPVVVVVVVVVAAVDGSVDQ